MKQHEDNERKKVLRITTISSLLALLLLKATTPLPWKAVGQLLIAYCFLMLLGYLLNKWAARRMKRQQDYINYVNTNQGWIKKAMDGLNDLMVTQEPNLTVEPNIWYDLNESIIYYIADFMNSKSGDPLEKPERVVRFVKDIALQLDTIIKSDEQQRLILELTERLDAKEPMYGVTPG